MKMLLIIYDIAEDRLRTKFSHFLSKYGRRIQFSVFEILNSNRVLGNIRVEIEADFQKKFQQADSVMIIHVPDDAIVARYGYARNEETDLLIM